MPAPANNPLLLQFGPFKLDPQACELRKGDTLLHLAPQPCKVLALLASRPQKVFTRQEIQHEIWGGDTFVDFEQGLNVAIRQIRAALCDDAETPRYIETLPRRGYRFIGRMDEHPAVAEGATITVPAESATLSAPAVLCPLLYRRSLSVVVCLAFAAAAVVFLWRIERGRAGASDIRPTIRSIAVLPLANLSGDPEQEYFADGMTDELITNLAKISALRVISRTSVMRYRNVQRPVGEIGKDLSADALIEGTVVRAGNSVRITVQLIQASTDRHLWAEEYHGDLQDVLRLQAEVAKAITSEVQVKLTSQEVRRADAHAVNPQAYELYLKGRYEWEKRSKPGFAMSLAFFQRAIDLDPNYAPAYAGMAQAYGLLGNNKFVPSNEVYPKAKAAALKALELDPNLADAHTSLAEIINDYDWNWPAAEEEYRRAIELNPNDATAHHWYAMTLAWRGRFDEAIAEIEKARQLDPLSMRINANVAQIFFWARDYERALLQCQKTLELEPNVETTHRIFGTIYMQKAAYQSAISEFQEAVDLAPGDARPLLQLSYGYAVTGQKEKALNIVRSLQKSSQQAYVSRAGVAAVYLALGKKDKALASLEKAVLAHDAGLLDIKVNPAFDSLRSDPRFSEVLRRRGLPQ